MHVYPTNQLALDSLPPEVRDEYGKKRIIRGDGDSSPEVILIKDFPSHDEAKQGRSFLGKDGLAIRKAMLDLGVPYYSTFVYPFFHGNQKPKLDDARRVTSIVTEEVQQINCNKFLLFGANTAKLLPLFQHPFSKFGDLLNKNIEVGDKTFRAVPHPAQLASNPQMYARFFEDVKELVYPGRRKRISGPAVESYFVHKERRTAERMLSNMPLVVSLDLETTGLDPYTCRILTVNISGKEGTGHAIPWEMFLTDEWTDFLRGHKFIFQNGSYDVKVLANNGVFVRIHEDTMLMHSLIVDAPGTHSMEYMAREYLPADKWGDMIDYANIEMEDPDTLGRYGARDADITLRLANFFRPQVDKLTITPILHEAQNSILRCELKGIKVDRDKAFQFQEEIESILHDKQQYIADTYGLANCNSPKQVQEVLYGELGLPKQKEKNKVTTNENAMKALYDAHPLPREILEYRHLTKASGMYLKNILEATERDGRYHPEFRLAATETGRVAEKLIMLIPRSDEIEDPDLGKQYQFRLRELFIPDEGNVMIGADYSGLEVAMAAHLTGDEQLIQDINDQLDTHSAVAIQAFDLDIPLEPYVTLKKRVSENHAYHRTVSKRATFTWLYGGSASAIAAQVGTDKSTAERILETLRSRYPRVASWQDTTKREAIDKGFVTTPWGRKRRFFFHKGLDRKVQEAQLREAINSPNQGMSSDITLAAFTNLEQRGLDMLFPMHDAAYLQATEGQAERVSQTVKNEMESILRSRVPFRVDIKEGYSWAELE